MRRAKWPTTYTQYFALQMQLPPAPKSLLSFHLGCDYALKKETKKKTSIYIDSLKFLKTLVHFQCICQCISSFSCDPIALEATEHYRTIDVRRSNSLHEHAPNKNVANSLHSMYLNQNKIWNHTH